VPRCFVSIGSNIERERNIVNAVRALDNAYGPLTLSRIYETAPVGFDGDNFYNLVAGFNTDTELTQLLERLIDIERASGRRRDVKAFNSRTLDLDLLLYGDLCQHDGKVDIPRRELTEHAFVLRPLAEIAPDLQHPESGKTMRELWRAFGDHGQKLSPVQFELPRLRPRSDAHRRPQLPDP
jgi:2-amino-4-hydroxy-6-hydroxymethyldihydropteridine diphosphokinase